MRQFEQRNAYFDRLCNSEGLMWLGQNTNHFEPHPAVRQAVIDALDGGEYHAYAPPLGFEELRRLIREDIGLPDASVMITDGAVEALYNVCRNICEAGKDFVTTNPSWAWPMQFAARAGSRVIELPIYSPEQNYKLTPAQLERALASKPKVFLFNNPSNPTGMVYTRDEIAAIADVLAKYPDTWIIADDIYNRMVFDGVGYQNVVQFRPELRERTAIVDSLSKTYGMPGWRVGFVAAPEQLANAVVTLNSNHITNIPEIVTAAAVAALTGPQDITKEKCADFAKRRDEVLDALLSIPGVKCPRPQGAFYAFPDISVAFGKSHNGMLIENDVDFCAALLDAKGVATVPGSAFGEPRALRISYTCPRAQLDAGLQRLKEFFAELTEAKKVAGAHA